MMRDFTISGSIFRVLGVFDIAKGGFCEPLASAQFLADTTLDILGEVIGIIFGLPERYLQHKEPLRSGFKPKCRKAQSNDFAGIDGINNTTAVDTVSGETIGVPQIGR